MVQKYEKPQAIVLNGNNEGVYLASGAGQWNISISDMHEGNGGHIFRAECTSTGAGGSAVVTITMQFNSALSDAVVDQTNEFSCSCSGNTVTITTNQAITYGSGYKMYPQITVKAENNAMTAGLACLSCSCG